MGMTERQILRRIELPIASPIIVGGFRTATLQVIATATIGALLSYGGFGRFIVDGIARSGMWLEGGMDHRQAAAQFVAKKYYNQNPRLLEFVLSKPPDRVRYNDLTLQRENFAEIEQLAKESGVIKGNVTFDDYVDVSFGQQAAKTMKQYDFTAAEALKALNK